LGIPLLRLERVQLEFLQHQISTEARNSSGVKSDFVINIVLLIPCDEAICLYLNSRVILDSIFKILKSEVSDRSITFSSTEALQNRHLRRLSRFPIFLNSKKTMSGLDTLSMMNT